MPEEETVRRKDLLKSQVHSRQGKKSFCRWRQARKQGATGKQLGTASAHLPPRPLHSLPAFYPWVSCCQPGKPYMPQAAPRAGPAPSRGSVPVSHYHASFCGLACHSPAVQDGGSVKGDRVLEYRAWEVERRGSCYREEAKSGISVSWETRIPGRG